jgi:hypothetical protein
MKNKKKGKRVSVNMLIVFCLFILTEGAMCQKIQFVNNHKAKDCYAGLFSLVENEWKLEGNLDLRNIEILSDSMSIRRKNDSVIIIIPKFENVYGKIYFSDRKTKTKIDSVIKYCNNNPFVFALTPNYNQHIWDPKKEIIRLYSFSKNSDCFDYSKDYKIVSYSLLIKRNDSTVIENRLMGAQLISKAIKDEVSGKAMKGDILYASNVRLINKNGHEITIKDYPLIKF